MLDVKAFVLRKVQARMLSFVILFLLVLGAGLNGWWGRAAIILGVVLLLWDWRLDVTEKRVREFWKVVDQLYRSATPFHATDLARKAGISVGKLYPILARLESLYWVERAVGVTHRALYSMTEHGHVQASRSDRSKKP